MLNTDISSLARLSEAQTRSISPENPTGAKDAGGMALDGTGAQYARDLGQGWKISPSVIVGPCETLELADIEGPGSIQHIWMTPPGNWRFSILRVYWDGAEEPAIECSIGDFFAMGWGTYAPLASLAVCVDPGSGFNCYWPMPFRSHARMTFTNIGDGDVVLYYQITYTLTDVPDDMGYLHAQFRRIDPLPYGDVYTILDGVRGQGHYVGAYLAWGANNNGWWGEGEIKFHLDGDQAWPTICATGTEDYFCGSYNFELQEPKRYQEFGTPYSGLHQVIRPDGLYSSQQRFGMYRWHLADPIRSKDLSL